MERNAKPYNAGHTVQDRDLAAEVLGAWADASSASGVPRKREIDAGRDLLRMAPVAGSGFAYPGLVRRVHVGGEDGAASPENHRETSFNDIASTDER